jgi:hypothetical protein
MWKLAIDIIKIFPGGMTCQSSTPLNEPLSHHAITTLGNATLQNLHRELEHGVGSCRERKYLSIGADAGLELGHIKNGVHMACYQQIMLVRNLGDAFQHMEGAKELEGELAVAGGGIPGRRRRMCALACAYPLGASSFVASAASAAEQNQ